MGVLSLKRRMGESIIIDGSIRVTVLPVQGRKDVVILAIEAPAEVPVHREEIQKKIDAMIVYPPVTHDNEE